jgi:hypothetical protein
VHELFLPSRGWKRYIEGAKIIHRKMEYIEPKPIDLRPNIPSPINYFKKYSLSPKI